VPVDPVVTDVGDTVMVPEPLAALAAATVSDMLLEAGDVAPLESVTVNVNPLAVPAAVGVPEITPVEAVKLKPAGSVPPVSDQLL
jgi:hypothetical protein